MCWTAPSHWAVQWSCSVLFCWRIAHEPDEPFSTDVLLDRDQRSLFSDSILWSPCRLLTPKLNEPFSIDFLLDGDQRSLFTDSLNFQEHPSTLTVTPQSCAGCHCRPRRFRWGRAEARVSLIHSWDCPPPPRHNSAATATAEMSSATGPPWSPARSCSAASASEPDSPAARCLLPAHTHKVISYFDMKLRNLKRWKYPLSCLIFFLIMTNLDKKALKLGFCIPCDTNCIQFRKKSFHPSMSWLINSAYKHTSLFLNYEYRHEIF